MVTAMSFKAVQNSASSHFNSKQGWLSCQLYGEKIDGRVHMINLVWHRGTLTSRKTLVCALPNEADQLRTGIRDASSDQNPVVEVTDYRPSGDGSFERSTPLGEEDDIVDKLRTLCLHLLASDQWNTLSLKKCDRTYLISGTNLIHYLAMKHLDIEQLKQDLLSTSLLNLDSINPYVLPGLTACIKTLESSISNYKKTALKFKNIDLSIADMRKQASDNKERLLGSLHDGRTTHIMVTVDQEALTSQSLIPDILTSGVSVIRINCAHGNQAIWTEIIRKVRQSSQMLEKPCRILMDLGGPKLRTDKEDESPCVMKISPRKNAAGELTLPAQVWLAYRGTDPPAHLSPDAVLYIDNQDFFSNVDLDDSVFFRDARDREIKLKISLKLSSFTGVMSECSKTAYVASGTQLYVKGKGKKKGKNVIAVVVDVPLAEQSVTVKSGDLLVISRDGTAERKKEFAPTSRFHRVKCSSGYLYDSVKPGETIAFDDGKIWGVIQGTSPSEIIVSVTHAGLKGKKLGSEKSINIPDSNIKFDGLTSKDIIDLEFVASQADMVGISFIRDVSDIVMVRKELQKLKADNLGVVLKIETKDGFEKLPRLLLEAMKSAKPLGVMIARGDLAVECGWERLADVQEEILSICSAAHIPVIWATQVLESLVKSGVPSRAEITDVASARRASCIMLNKGKNVREAILMLNAILQKSSLKQKAA
ncbi:hypothetical protein RND81_12G103400 [Saponaria officinalis]|uniref:pyruvate kinase n=1 Tax=Saponaria officinalis TaxID=3572 RepID=A0AAW1H8U0_SAPOF